MEYLRSSIILDIYYLLLCPVKVERWAVKYLWPYTVVVFMIRILA